MAAPIITKYTEQQAVDGMIAGHIMAGMPPTAEDIAATRRGYRGETTAEQESDRVIAEIIADRRR